MSSHSPEEAKAQTHKASRDSLNGVSVGSKNRMER